MPKFYYIKSSKTLLIGQGMFHYRSYKIDSFWWAFMVKDFLAALEIKKSLDNEYDFFFCSAYWKENW